jgi:hypothetical protein
VVLAAITRACLPVQGGGRLGRHACSSFIARASRPKGSFRRIIALTAPTGERKVAVFMRRTKYVARTDAM